LSGRDPAGEGHAVRAAIGAVLARPTTRVVPRQSGVAAAVRELGVRPAAEWSAPQPVLTQLRVRGGASYYYLWNASPRPLSFTGSFAAEGRPVRADLWTGAQRLAPGRRVAGGRWAVPLELGPRETAVLAFSPRNPAGAASRLRRSPERAITVGPWRLAVESWGPGGRTKLRVRHPASLRPWSSIPGLESVSGIGTYTATVNVPSSWIGPERGARLDLGSVAGAVQTYVNGKPASREIDPTSPVDVSSLLRPGANTVKVVLATTLMNRALVTPSVFAGRPRFEVEASAGRQAYGLLGPVRLLPERRRGSPAR
jgi:hypothetical protein